MHDAPDAGRGGGAHDRRRRPRRSRASIVDGSRTHVAFTPATWKTVPQPRIAGEERRGVVEVAAHGLGARGLDAAAASSAAGERADLPALVDEPAHERAADEPATRR